MPVHRCVAPGSYRHGVDRSRAAADGVDGSGLVVVDIFCGAGGLSEGFRLAGFDVAYALDRDLDSCESYRLNHDKTKLEQASITDRRPKSWARMFGDVDVIVGGPSCQGFSTHGRPGGQRGRQLRWADPKDVRNRLWNQMHGVVSEARPRAFLLENVPGLAYAKDGRVQGEILRRFEELGYTVQAEILLAADYGIPQLRRRVFVVGVRKGLRFEFPSPTHLGGWRRDTLHRWETERQQRGLLRHISSWEAIGDLPPLTSTVGRVRSGCTAPTSDYARLMRGATSELRDHEASSLGKYESILMHVPPGGTWRDVPPHLLPDRYRGMRRTDSTNLLGRLDPDRPAYTITTQFGNVTAGCFAHPFENRPISVREGARLQSFPDRYAFVGSASSRCRQIGNAVPPLLAQHIACALAEALECGSHVTRPTVVRSVRETASGLTPPSEATRRRLTRQARVDTAPEVGLRRELFRLGLRFRRNVRPVADLRREADVYFPRERVVVFVDGCFWHGCPEHFRPTKSNTKWWAEKIAKNRQRDEATSVTLGRAGFEVLRVWEHEEPAAAARRVNELVRSRRTP